MKHTKKITSILLLAALVGCQTPPTRTPSSVILSKDFRDIKDWQELRELKQKSVELSAQTVHYVKKKNETELAKIKNEQDEINKKISEIESRIGSLDSDQQVVIQNDNKNWRVEKDNIELAQLDLYKDSNKVELSVSTYEATETKIQLTHKFFSTAGYTVVNHDDAKPTMNFNVRCDAPFAMKYGISTKKIMANEVYKFRLGDKKISNDYRDITLNSNFKTCTFTFVSSIDSADTQYSFNLVNEGQKLSNLSHLINTTEVCSVKKDSGKFFDTTEFPNMTCPLGYDSIKILPEPEDSLYARIDSLLGTELPADFIKNGNPYAPLDFSRAPKFDAVLVSYLVFRADFYGTLMARLLAYHADKGANVRIIVSDVISLDKDKIMYEKLMAKHPDIKVVKYKFDNKQQGGAWISELHRTNHVKLFITYSKENPEDSMAIVGGKNIHDGFVFRTPVDVSKFPEMVNYVTGDESWAYWRDFEMVIKGQEFTESLVRHYMNFYHINKENLVMKISSVAVAKENVAEAKKGTIRSYVSIPFKDEQNLNLYYSRLIDTAKKKVLISSPYFRPVKEIADALDRAIDRGVDITIITRLDLEGDTADFILGAVNKDGVNKFLKKVKVFEYIEPKVILHSKLLMIDDELSFISSVNLNKRSFYHDLENGVIVNDPKFTSVMDKLYKDYLKISVQLTEKQKIEFWKRWIIKVFDKVL